MLSCYRVVDMTDDRGHLAGHMLAWLGAEVLAIEPPEGTRSRHHGPFADDAIDVDHSLEHWAFNRGKRSVVLDLDGSETDRGHLRRLLAGADVVIDHDRRLAELGLDDDALHSLNPALVHASISAFGAEGPKCDWMATDLTVWAAAGPLVLTGDMDRPPLEVGIPQAFHHAAAEAAGSILAALLERNGSGLGQRVDVSAQLASMQATQSTVLAAPNGATTMERSAGSVRFGPLDLRLMWPCRDGFVSVTFLFGTGIGPATRRLMEWACEEGCCDEATRDKDWIGYGELLLTGQEPVEEFERVKGVVTALCASKTREELLDAAMARGLLIAPVQMIDDVVHSPQYEARDYWDEVDGRRHPGPFAMCSATPLQSPGRAPRLGEHTAAVLAEPDRRPAVPEGIKPADERPGRPLEGLKVLDFMWVMAGPAASRVLADLGATVVRVESSRRIETARTLQPFRDDVNDTETSVLFANLNAGKLGAALDLAHPESVDVVHDLVRWADVVTESFSPKAMRNFGLDYEQLRAIRPDVIMASSCLFGQNGPYAEFAGYGTMAAAMSGFFGITGWPDRAPAGPFGAYTDYISPRFLVATLLAAVDHRRRTGEGQYIDFAQAEASIHTLAPAVLEYTVNGSVRASRGNEHPRHRPSGVYPALGDDEWVAVACADDDQREALATIVGGIDDDAVSAWSRSRTASAATETLQAAGVPAHAVQRSTDIAADPQVAHLGHLVTVPHPTVGELLVEGPRVHLSRTPACTTQAGPTLGQHTEHVLTELLGYDEQRFVELVVSGAIE